MKTNKPKRKSPEYSPEERERRVRLMQERNPAKTPEARAKISQKVKASWVGRESKISEVWANYTPEERAHRLRGLRESLARRAQDPEYAQYVHGKIGTKMQAWWANLPQDERETYQARLRALWTPERREYFRRIAQERWAKPGFLESWLRRWEENPSSLEVILYEVLDGLGVAYLPQCRKGSYICDAFIPGENIVLEVDGEFWHSSPEAQEHDARRDQWMRGQGIRVRRISEQEILDDPIGSITNALLQEGF